MTEIIIPMGSGRITISRLINAPRALVFQAWVEPKHLLQWFRASPDWTTPHAQTDPQAGGAFSIGFAGPGGASSFNFDGVYSAVRPPEHLAFTIADGRPVTVDFSEEDGQTRITLDLTLEDSNSAELQREGWTAMLVNLDEYLAQAG